MAPAIRVHMKDPVRHEVVSSFRRTLHAKGFEIDKKKISMADPFKALGEYTVPLKIHRDVTAQLKITLFRTIASDTTWMPSPAFQMALPSTTLLPRPPP